MWKKSQYPCKNFFAVFKAYHEWDFNALPEDYKTSVFITLDTKHFNVNFLVFSEEDTPAAQIRKDNSIEETKDAFSEGSSSELLDIIETQVGRGPTDGIKTGQPSLSCDDKFSPANWKTGGLNLRGRDNNSWGN